MSKTTPGPDPLAGWYALVPLGFTPGCRAPGTDQARAFLRARRQSAADGDAAEQDSWNRSVAWPSAGGWRGAEMNTEFSSPTWPRTDVRADGLFLLTGFPVAFSLTACGPVLCLHRRRARPARPALFQALPSASSASSRTTPCWRFPSSPDGADPERSGMAEEPFSTPSARSLVPSAAAWPWR